MGALRHTVRCRGRAQDPPLQVPIHIANNILYFAATGFAEGILFGMARRGPPDRKAQPNLV